ncbi:MAG TPA: PPK2 family polyphosphate kinase [Acidobacteriaceae bacterium]|jgi:PPK2 family polyphosphate:nucleotide phosphotransferase|nr:PPK2 family polyphosphate kinase [Acidobacteriaceae bacterium]
MKLKSPYLIKPHTKVRLAHLPTEERGALKSKRGADAETAKHLKQLEELQEVFYAAQSTALLVVLQGMDTAGKDGTIRHIFSGVNPQGCQVASFKVPTALETRHDFLWRCHAQVPPRGMIGIFNRSHYEDVLSPVVHGHMSAKEARRHMDEINGWERTLADNDVVILKFFLHISREEQTRRLQARIDDAKKHWKLSPADFEERPLWDDYMRAYEEILRNTSRKVAPWFVIPADNKSYRSVAISRIVIEAMQRLKLRYPKPTFDPGGVKLEDESPEEAANEVETKVNPGTVSANETRSDSGRTAATA